MVYLSQQMGGLQLGAPVITEKWKQMKKLTENHPVRYRDFRYLMWFTGEKLLNNNLNNVYLKSCQNVGQFYTNLNFQIKKYTLLYIWYILYTVPVPYSMTSKSFKYFFLLLRKNAELYNMTPTNSENKSDTYRQLDKPDMRFRCFTFTLHLNINYRFYHLNVSDYTQIQ